MNKLPDIYYLPNWRELYKEKENGEAAEYKFENENGIVLYPYIKRKIDIPINGKYYFDIITPYGFNGPIILEGCRDRKKLVKEFNKEFQKYCEENNIIAEYIRFSPWFRNYLDFKEEYNLRLNKKTIAINLLVDDILTDEINGKRRNCIRSAIKKGVNIEFDFQGETIDDFYRLYQKTIKKNDISEYYWLSKDFLHKHFEKLKGNVFIANAVFNGIVISSSIFVYQDKQLHYLYSANDYEYTYLNGNSLLLYEVANWGKENRKRVLTFRRSKQIRRFNEI